MTTITNNIIKKILSLWTLLSLWLGIFAGVPVRASVTQEKDVLSSNTLQKDEIKVPLVFEQNEGQIDKSVKFLGRGNGYTLFLTDDGGATFKLDQKNSPTVWLKMQIVGADSEPQVEGAEILEGKTNYFKGNNPKNWHRGISNFAKVKYKNIYDGIEMVYYSRQNELEYDFNVSPNVSPDRIKIKFDGADKVEITKNGSLQITVKDEILEQKAPVSFQEIDGKRIAVKSRFTISETGEVGFAIGEYDQSKPLTIDPTMRYLTYIGGFNGSDSVREIAVDPQRNVYLTGTTGSTDFTFNGVPRNSDDSTAAFVAKLNPIASQFLYLTILEGEFEENGNDIAIDSLNNAYITGNTKSNDFPVLNAYQPVGDRCVPIVSTCWSGFHQGDAFVTKLGNDGGLLYSSYLGGHDEDIGYGIAFGPNNFVYVTGYTESWNFPKYDQYQSLGKTFLTVIPTNGTDPIYSTRFDAGSFQTPFGDVAVDSAGNAYIVTNSDDNNSPVKNAFQPNNNGGIDVTIAKFNPFSSGENSLVYSTYLGGTGTDIGKAIAVTPQGIVHITGVTGSVNFPIVNQVDSTNQVNEAFVTILNPNGTLFASTFLGGNSADSGNAITLDSSGVIYVTGSTQSSDFQRVFAFQTSRNGTQDAFITKLRLGGSGSSAILSSSYLGNSGSESGEGIAVFGNRFVYFAGTTTSSDLATSGGVVKPDVILGTSFQQGFVAHVRDTQRDTVGVYNPLNIEFLLRNTNNPTGIASLISATFGISGDSPIIADWNGDGIDTLGTFNNGVWKYRNFNVATGYPTPPLTFNFGQSGDVPLAGDWNADGIETPGVFRPSTGQFFLSDSLSNPQANRIINFGQNGDLPIAGDWNADGIDSVGIYRPSNGTFLLTNTVSGSPKISNTFQFGTAEDLPVAGDWNADGFDDVALWKPSTNTFTFDTDKATGADLPSLIFGAAGNIPLAGEWEGRPN